MTPHPAPETLFATVALTTEEIHLLVRIVLSLPVNGIFTRRAYESLIESITKKLREASLSAASHGEEGRE